MSTTWTLTRIDRANSMELERQEFPGLAELVTALRERDIPLTDEHMTEIERHPDTQFERMEMVFDGLSGFSACVQYDLRPTANLSPPRPPREYLRCRSCGTTGHAGGYPFSTLPGSGQCDDCL